MNERGARTGPRRAHRWSLISTTVAAISGTAAAAAVWIWLRSPSAIELAASDVAMAFCYPVLAGVILWRQPHNRAGHLLLTTGLLGPYLLAGVYAVDASAVHGRAGPLVDAATWLAMWGWMPYLVVVALVPLHLPDGSLPGRRWQPYAVGLMVLQAAGVLAAMVADGSPEVSRALTNPLGVAPERVSVVTALAGFGSFLVGGPVAVVALVGRLRRSAGPDRARLGWVVFGLATLLVLAVVSLPLRGTVAGEVAMTLGVVSVPLTIGIAVVRHRLFDIEVILNRAIVYGVSTAFVLVTYAGVVAVVGSVAAGTRWALPLVALAALAAAGGRQRLQYAVDRLLHGERRDPYAMITRTGDRLERVREPTEALQVLVEEVRRLLRVPWIAVVPADHRLPTVESGVTSPHHHFLPLNAYGALVGELRVGHRQPGERLRRSDRGALAEVARRAATLVWSALLVDELRRSRDEAQRRSEQVVVGREEERRRLRRDLHDGVGPELAGMALRMQRLVPKIEDPVVAAQAAAVGDQLRRTVAAVRGVVDDLRPAALDEMGLVGALRAHVLAGAGGGEGPDVHVDADDLTGLSAAVEVAAYRIATEALTNAVRHAQAHHTRLTLRRHRAALVLTVADDGTGVAPDAAPGVGTTSMRERAAELGGTLHVSRGPDGGTIVTATLPDARSRS